MCEQAGYFAQFNQTISVELVLKGGEESSDRAHKPPSLSHPGQLVKDAGLWEGAVCMDCHPSKVNLLPIKV